MTVGTRKIIGVRVQITGFDAYGHTDLMGIVGTVTHYYATTGRYLVSYYNARAHRYEERLFPIDSLELIDSE